MMPGIQASRSRAELPTGRIYFGESSGFRDSRDSISISDRVAAKAAPTAYSSTAGGELGADPN